MSTIINQRSPYLSVKVSASVFQPLTAAATPVVDITLRGEIAPELFGSTTVTSTRIAITF
ncbi:MULTISPECIES: hypothetical protein [unclassified Nostoc]|uniref:hypothetical protein n=1 Tax=unclassified Nostoc TaxID=2593658 RepID=UPI0026059CE2|nr:hypothetical protein [Nostoc sp. S13]MDF5737486.1 hypothetical protein [Nostoc sp. S13]